MAKLALLLVLFAGCTATGECPETPYWNPLTCRCHSSASGGFADKDCCLKPNVSLGACPTDAPAEPTVDSPE